MSRAPLQNQENGELQDEIELFIDFIIRNLPVTDKRLKQIKESQDNDLILSKWKEAFQGGKRRDKSTNYNDLSIINGILMRGNRIVIPKGLQNEILDQLHSGHQGIFKCKERARCSVWWPNITVDIEKYIKNCRICCQFQRPQIEPLCPEVLKREQKENFDRRHRTTYHSPLEPGDEVWIPDREISGQIVDQTYPRSYNIVTTGNGILKRNRQAIRALPNNERSLLPLDQSTKTSNEEKRGDRNFELRRSTRPSKPPERYGLRIN